MKAHFNAPYPLFGRANKRLSEGYQQRSPYYWWWQYLRRNEDYLDCCQCGGGGKLARLYEDFGDVRANDFHKWWTEGGRGAYLFAEQPLAVRFGELESAADWQSHWKSEDVLVVAVPLNVSKRRLKGEFAKLLDSRHSGNKSGRPSMAKLQAQSTARYQLEKNYTIRGLSTALAVFDGWAANHSLPKSQRLTLWELGVEMKLNRSAAKDAVSTSTHDRLEGRNVLAATVSRYVRQARGLIANTAHGKFPML